MLFPFQGVTAPTRLPIQKAPLHHEGGGSYTILHGKILNPKHITKQGCPNRNMKEARRTYL